MTKIDFNTIVETKKHTANTHAVSQKIVWTRYHNLQKQDKSVNVSEVKGCSNLTLNFFKKKFKRFGFFFLKFKFNIYFLTWSYNTLSNLLQRLSFSLSAHRRKKILNRAFSLSLSASLRVIFFPIGSDCIPKSQISNLIVSLW